MERSSSSDEPMLPSQAQRLVDAFEAGTLTKEQLRKGLDSLLAQPQEARQDLLYLQTMLSSPASPVLGITLIEGGQIIPQQVDPRGWPYQSVLDAIRDGWRVISFPNMALMLAPAEETPGFAFEFILERWK